MVPSKILAPAAVLLVAFAIGGALTRNSHGTANVVSNVCFFGLAILLLLLLAAGVAALFGRRAQNVR
jgi:type III secretory pathway component EscR